MKKFYFRCAPVLLFCFLFACANDTKEVQLARKEAPPVNVEVAKVEALNIPSSQQFSGRIASDKQVNLSTKLMGTITFLQVKEGQRVSKGDVLFKIKSSDLDIKKAQVRAEMQQANVVLKSAEKDLKRFEVLKSQQSATQQEVDQFRTQVDVAKAQIETIRQMEKEIEDAMSYSSVTAPFSGKVIMKHLNQGDMATPGMPVLTIENNKTLKAYIHIPEPDIASVKKGSELTMTVDALEGAVFTEKVERINTTPDGQYEAVISISAKNPAAKNLKTGMYVKAAFEKGNTTAIAIPRKSIVTKGQLKGVYTPGQNNEALLRWIKPGKIVGDNITVLAGLSTGESYIINSEERLTNGRKINVTNKR